MDFEYFVPTKVIMKKNCSTDLGKFAKEEQMSHVLFVTDEGIKNSGMLHRMYQSVEAEKISSEEFYDVQPNPKDKDCEHAANQFQDRGLDGIIAIGGGSVIDTAKSLSILLTNGGNIQDYEGLEIAQNDPLPIICIPTTAGTGSEVTSWSIITDTENQYKMGVGDSRIIPKLALLDVELTASMPPSIAASTGMDALTHAIEAYTCNISNPVTDAMSLHAIKLIKNNIMEAVHVSENELARENMLIASLIAGAAFGNADTAAVHCVSEAIGGKYDTPHGIANSIFLPYVFAHNLDADIKRHGEIGYVLGADRNKSFLEAAKEAVTILLTYNDRLDIPKFYELDNVNSADFSEIAKKSIESSSNPHNIKEMKQKDYKKLLDDAYKDLL